MNSLIYLNISMIYQNNLKFDYRTHISIIQDLANLFILSSTNLNKSVPRLCLNL